MNILLDFGANEMKGYKVKIDRNIDYDRGYYDEAYENYLSSDIIEETDSAPDVVTEIDDLQSGERVYLVWVEYSYGDSYNQSYKGEIEVIGITRFKHAAEELKTYIEECNTRNNWKCNLSDGQTIEMAYIPWLGYFENLEEIHIDEVIIQ